MEMIVSRRAEIVRSVPVTLRLDSVMGDVLRGGKGLGVNQAVLMGSMERIALRSVGLVWRGHVTLKRVTVSVDVRTDT